MVDVFYNYKESIQEKGMVDRLGPSKEPSKMLSSLNKFYAAG